MAISLSVYLPDTAQRWSSAIPTNMRLGLYVQPVGGDMPDLSDADPQRRNGF
ncbi:hypothetical protein [Mycobacterium sp. URHB0021]